MPADARSLVLTFYSYKGGVGRTMALANIAVGLALRGKRVLAMDWDLEAPGLDRYFRKQIGDERRRTSGIVDLVHSYLAAAPVDWRECTLRVELPGGRKLDLISAGRDDDEYSAKLHSIHWPAAFEEGRLGNYLEQLRAEWLDQYDFVLIDSRTGVTDIGGICTISLPDILICLFTSNNQNFFGLSGVLDRIRAAHANLQLDRQRLVVFPVPTRDESDSEYEQARSWRAKYATAFTSYFEDWLPRYVTPLSALDRLRIRYVPHWSFGENLPILEEDVNNPKTLAYSFKFVADVLYYGLDWEQAVGPGRRESSSDRDTVLAEARKYRSDRIEPAIARAKDYVQLIGYAKMTGTGCLIIASLFTLGAPLLYFKFDRMEWAIGSWAIGSSYLLAFTMGVGAILYWPLGLFCRALVISRAAKVVALEESNERLRGEVISFTADVNSARFDDADRYAEHVARIEDILRNRPSMDGGTVLSIFRRWRLWIRRPTPSPKDEE